MTTGPGMRTSGRVTAVLVELPAAPEDVEVEPTRLPDPAHGPAWRRWSWLVALVPTVALIVYQRAAPSSDSPVPSWIVVATAVGLLLTALFALIRYQDDRLVAALDRERAALLAHPRRTTGTLILGSPAATATDRIVGRVSFTDAEGVIEGSLDTVVPSGLEPPRDGDPVAVWFAEGTDVALVRYHRTWADEVLRALHPDGHPDDGGPLHDSGHE